MIVSSTCCCSAGGLALSALRYAVLNQGAASCQHPCPLRRFAPALPKGELLAVRQVSHFILYALLPQKEPSGAALRFHAFTKASHFGRGGIAQAMTERASPAEAAQSLGLDRASDGAVLPQGSAFVSQLLTFFSHTYSSTFLQILNVEVFLWNRKSAASP